MTRKIICFDLDAFYASVEIRDNPELSGKPLIIGAKPEERGVVSTCSYEARVYGVRSAMSIKEAYRLCPDGIYMHPNFHKYEEASRQIHAICDEYTDQAEYISLDEGFLDVTGTEHLFGGAEAIGREIKRRVKSETKLICSVGIGYSLMSAKLASEEKKPDGFFQIPTPEALINLIIDRNVRIVYGVGAQTADALKKIGVFTVRDILNKRHDVVTLLGNHGRQIIELADGIDERKVIPHAKAKSLGKEHTFQYDITDFDYLKDVLRLIAKELSYQIKLKGIYCRTVTLKVTYRDMKKITRSVSGDGTDKACDIYGAASAMLDKIDKRPVRLAGITLSNFTDTIARQISLTDSPADGRSDKLDAAFMNLQCRFGFGIIKTAAELNAEQNVKGDKKEAEEKDFNKRY